MLKTSFFFSPSRFKRGITSVYLKAKHIPLINLKRFQHSVPVLVDQNKMKIQIIPALDDNYMYLLIDEDTREAAIVDPVAPEKVICALKEHQVKLTKILTTHHHWDHAGGNESMVGSVPGIQVFGGDNRIGALTCVVSHGNIINVGSIKIECLYTPCHTTGHICYYATKEGAEPAVFTGDTLFVAGCGRFFEGTPDQMHKALNCILAKLPDETRVYCGHEYTATNLKFALTVEPNNPAMKEKLEWACCRRKENMPTIPSTIGEEKMINPFMRVGHPDVQSYTGSADPLKVMECLRKKKDAFKA